MWLNEYASQTAERLVRCERESELKERLAFIEQCLGSDMPDSTLAEFWQKVLGRYSREARQVLRESVTMGTFGEVVVTAEEILGEKLRALKTRGGVGSGTHASSGMIS